MQLIIQFDLYTEFVTWIVKSLLLNNRTIQVKELDRRTHSTRPPPSYDQDIANLPSTSHIAGY